MIKKLIIIICLLGMSSIAFAKIEKCSSYTGFPSLYTINFHPGFVIGGDAGWSYTHLRQGPPYTTLLGTLTGKTRENNFALRVYGGYQFTPSLSFRVGYTYFGNNRIFGAKVREYGIDTTAVINTPELFYTPLSVFGQIGVGFLHRGVLLTPRIDGNVFTVVYGGGLRYTFPNTSGLLHVNLSFLRYVGNPKVTSSNYVPSADIYSLGLSYRLNLA